MLHIHRVNELRIANFDFTNQSLPKYLLCKIVKFRKFINRNSKFAVRRTVGCGATSIKILFPLVDLDYFGDAVDYLCAHEKIESSKGIGVVGISKSAEIALLMATYFGDKVSAVVAMNGMPLLTGRYKYQGKDLLKGKGG